MHYMNVDGITSDSSKSLLRMLKQAFTAKELAKLTDQPVEDVEILLTQFLAEGFAAAYKGKYIITDKGRFEINEEAMQYN